MQTSTRTLLVTGGAGFIGSNFVLGCVTTGFARVITLDSLTYAGNVSNLASLEGDPRHAFVRGDIRDTALVRRLLSEHRPDALVHFAAESHVDRSIDAPDTFVQTNVVGTFSLLEAVRGHLASSTAERRGRFRFLHVSTDEVFGTLGSEGYFREDTSYAPNSPYSASKAASDMFVRAYHHTYGVPTITTNCSNNYGPFQFPEKLIPLMILNCLERKPLPVYGTGRNVRDWLYVEDHCAGIRRALEMGKVGETYLFGGRSERTNLEMVHEICDVVDELTGKAPGTSRGLVTFVADRPGHDMRYAVDPSKAEREIGWTPSTKLSDGLRRTVRWYLDKQTWCADITSGGYRRERLGIGNASDAKGVMA
ncbi:MAG TPA: dTDP-glucose 4,6-dehydratase [Labilithrix sp.]|nr:dTDP-glucose 4,6-dehydratase [Labilithrix sp.]